MKKAIVIINSQNKKSMLIRNLYDVCKILTKKNYHIEVRLTKKELDTLHITYEKRNYDLIVVAGGDGTMNEITNALKERKNKPNIMYFPSGTVNDFGTSLKIPKNFNKQLKMLIKENIKMVDTGIVNNKYFNYICAFGPFTRASYLASHLEKRRFGIFAYYRYVIEDIPLIKKNYLLEIEVDNEIIKGEFAIGMIVNSQSVAGFRKFLRYDKLDDGYFNLILLDTHKLTTFKKGFDHIYNGVSVKDKDFIFRKFQHLKIKTNENIQWILDGEKGPVGSIEIKVIKNNLSIIVP